MAIEEDKEVRIRACVIGAAIMLGAVPISAQSASRFALFASDPRVAKHLPLKYIANTFGCAGENVSPALYWRNAPSGTRSFVLTLFDPDERSTPSGWWHWIVYDIPERITRLAASAGASMSPLLPKGAREGRTDLGNRAYVGPCPAKGDPPHEYRFTLYALRIEKLPVNDGADGAMVTSVAQNYVLGKAVLVVPYGR